MSREELLDWIVGSVPEAIHRELPDRRDTCVLSTRTGIDICRYFGIDAKPVVVRTIAYNKKWGDFASTHPHLLDDINAPEWLEAREHGAWSIAIDERDRNERGRFAGHLLLYAPGDPDYVLDLSLAQFRRKEHGMDFPDAMQYAAPPGFLDGEALMLEQEDGAVIAYRVRPGISTFRRGGDWKMHNPISGPLIRKARAELS